MILILDRRNIIMAIKGVSHHSQAARLAKVEGQIRGVIKMIEYGTDWVISHIIETELDSANVEEAFEESIRDCYPETTKVGWMEFDTVSLMKEQDPASWRCALSEYESEEESEGNIISFDNGSTYYRTSDLESLIEQEGL
jgi:hypothetical protein